MTRPSSIAPSFAMGSPIGRRFRVAAAAPATLAMALMLALNACAGTPHIASVKEGKAAYDVVPVEVTQTVEGGIDAGDHLAIRVLGEAELTSDYVVDDQGLFQMPLLGEINAVGMTARQLRDYITAKLGARYIRHPQVAVAITARPRSTFTVEGQVTSPGRFEVSPDMTLIGAMALSKSPTATAKLANVVVFRQIKGERYGARFSLRDIRAGVSPDPQIIAGDTIVVGNSAIKALWRDFLQAAPTLGLFASFAR